MSGGLLHLWHENRSVLEREAWGLVGGRNRAAFSWRQEEGLEVFFFPMCARFGILSVCLEIPFMSRLFPSVTVIVFPYGVWLFVAK